MKKDNISDAIGALPDDIIEDAAAVRNTRSARPYSMVAKFAALAAVFALCIVGVRYLPALTPPDPVGTEPPIISPDEVGTENPTEAPSDATAETPTEDSSIASTEPPTEAPTETPTVVKPTPSGGFTPCIHSTMAGDYNLDFAYHTISAELIKYVGRNKFNEYIKLYEEEENAALEAYMAGERDCPYYGNIVAFVEYFEIPREAFELVVLNTSMTIDYNIDAIYGGEEIAEKYYKSDRSQELAAKNILYSIKGQLAHTLRNDKTGNFSKWASAKIKTGWYGTELLKTSLQKYESEKINSETLPADQMEFNTNNNEHFSLTELIHALDIPREKVEEVYNKYKTAWGFKGELDLDALYAAEFDEEYFKTTSPLEIDMQFFTYDGK